MQPFKFQQGNTVPSESIRDALKLLPTRFLLRHNGGVDIGDGTVNWREMKRWIVTMYLINDLYRDGIFLRDACCLAVTGRGDVSIFKNYRKARIRETYT